MCWSRRSLARDHEVDKWSDLLVQDEENRRDDGGDERGVDGGERGLEVDTCDDWCLPVEILSQKFLELIFLAQTILLLFALPVIVGVHKVMDACHDRGGGEQVRRATAHATI